MAERGADAALLREIADSHEAIPSWMDDRRSKAGALVMIADEWVPLLRALADVLDKITPEMAQSLRDSATLLVVHSMERAAGTCVDVAALLDLLCPPTDAGSYSLLAVP